METKKTERAAEWSPWISDEYGPNMGVDEYESDGEPPLPSEEDGADADFESDRMMADDDDADKPYGSGTPDDSNPPTLGADESDKRDARASKSEGWVRMLRFALE